MASKIKVLPDHTINQIAAGEVIENPASVVKELVENALDAEASAIAIEIRGGGRQLIRVSDNGCGMSQDDALLCLERHATSKLRHVEDIHTLMTMGFRGEAIPSIASISKFNILTSTGKESDAGTMVIVDGGKVVSCTPAVRSQGTTIEVKNLFFNVPVRKKFLKSPAIDANEIQKTVSLIALGHPNIAFTLTVDGKTEISTTPVPQTAFQGKFEERVRSLMGQDFIKNATPIHIARDGLSIQGYVGIPTFTRHNRSGQFLFINNRAITSPAVAFAVKEGFGSAIDGSRFPVFVLHLSMPGDWVDVNVHPQKREVRLRHEQTIRELVTESVRTAIAPKHSPEVSFSVPVSPVFAKALTHATSFSEKEPTSAWEFTPRPTTATQGPILKSDRFEQPTLPSQRTVAEESAKAVAPKVVAAIPGYLILDGSSGSLFSQNAHSIVVADQRHAHSRILFERLSAALSGAPAHVQALLIPHTIDLPPAEAAEMRQTLPYLNRIGVKIHEFGNNAFIIEALPDLLEKGNPAQVVKDLASAALSAGEQEGLFQERTKAAALAASRSTLHSYACLTREEGQALMNQLANCTQPAICPQGRPVFCFLTTDEIAKLFQKQGSTL